MKYYPRSVEELEEHEYHPERRFQYLYDDFGFKIGWLYSRRFLKILRIDDANKVMIIGIFGKEFVIWR